MADVAVIDPDVDMYDTAQQLLIDAREIAEAYVEMRRYNNLLTRALRMIALQNGGSYKIDTRFSDEGHDESILVGIGTDGVTLIKNGEYYATATKV